MECYIKKNTYSSHCVCSPSGMVNKNTFMEVKWIKKDLLHGWQSMFSLLVFVLLMKFCFHFRVCRETAGECYFDKESDVQGWYIYFKILFSSSPKPVEDSKEDNEVPWSDTAPEILHLNDDTFDNALKENPSIMVMFYAPCKYPDTTLKVPLNGSIPEIKGSVKLLSWPDKNLSTRHSVRLMLILHYCN